MGGRIQLLVGMVLATSLIITACRSTQEASLETRNKELVRRLFQEVWNTGNLKTVDELYSADFVLHFLPDGSESRGLDKQRDHVRDHRKAFPDWAEEIKQIVAEGDLVVTHFVSTGTNEGSFMGNPPTEKKTRANEMSIFRIADGKIAEQWLLPDLFSMNQQLGLISQKK